MTALEILNANKIPTHSVIEAVRVVREMNIPPMESGALVAEITSRANPFAGKGQKTRHYLMYLVQNFVRHHDKSVDEICMMSEMHTHQFFEKVDRGDFGMKFDDEQITTAVITNKQEIASNMLKAGKSTKEVVDLLIKEHDMSLAGARTYVYTAKSKLNQ